MARVINRYPGEIAVPVTGTPLKTFWRAFGLPAQSTALKQYTQGVESFGELEGNVDGRVDLSNVLSVLGEPESSSKLLQATLLRTAMTDRKIVFINDTIEHRFFSTDFTYQHDAQSNTIIEFFSDLDRLTFTLGNTSASVLLFDKLLIIENYAQKFLVTSSVGAAVSKHLRLELFSKNLEHPVVGSRVNYQLRVKLSTLGLSPANIFETTLEASTLHEKRWQMEYRLESNF